jgi:hypothetical protein
MRVKTRQELTKLAELMVKEFNVMDIINTEEFIDYAADIIEDENLDINIQTVDRWLSWLEQKVTDLAREEEKEKEKFDVDQIVKEMNLDEEVLKCLVKEEVVTKELKITINLYTDGTYEVIKPKKEVTPSSSRVPNYTMFIEGEDGYLITRGAYRGKYVQNIDEGSWVGCAAGWANKILSDNVRLGEGRPGALTDDDKLVLENIKMNKI